MANTQSVCTSFKVEQLNGLHAFGVTVIRAATTADTFKAALYLASATMNAASTAYTATNELTGTGYTAGGVTFTWIAPASTGTTAFSTPSAAFAWTGLTSASAFDATLLYNSAQANRGVGVYTFGSQNVTASNFSLTMPTNDATTGLLRIA
jgi:hypothetical protein